MKTTKRILAIVLAMLMMISTCAVAGSAAGNLQAAINAAAAGATVTMAADTTESVVINKDLTLDLGGFELKSVPGSVAITVIGANVTITNGHVVSQFADVKSLTMLETVVNESPAAINVRGGSVSVEGVRAVGSMTRIPTTSKYHFPTGSAIALTDGATATVKQSSLVGRYGVNNKVTNDTAGGSVTIEDAIMMGFMRAVKDSSKEIVADDTEKVNAADRIEGFLNSGIKLEDRERNLLKRIFAERVMLYTKSVQDEATSVYSECTDKVTVTAHEDVSNIWQNNTSTDCSYKYVPEYVVLADGTLVKMTANGSDYTAEIDKDQADGIQVKYRLTFDMQPDIQGLTTNFNAYLEDLYQKVIKTAGEVYDYALEKYTNYTKLVGDIAKKLDGMGNEEIAGQPLKEIGEYNRIRRAIYDLGGKTVWEAARPGYTFGNNQYKAIYGQDKTMPEDGIVGTIDRVTKLKGELESFMPFSDQSKWADLGYWVYENYTEVLDIIDEALERIEALQTILDGSLEQQLIEMANLQDKRATLDKVQKITSDVKAALDRILASHTVQYFIEKADSHKSELKPYINKFISIYNNHEVYFTPSKFLDGNFAKAYAVYGDVKEDTPIKHSFTNYVSDGNATCTADGTKTAECDNGCGAKDTITDEGSMIAHSFTNYVSDNNATCTADGTKTAECDYGCGAKDTITDEGSMIKHSFTNYVSDNNATCTADGTKTAECDYGCGAKDTIADEGSMIKHSFTNYVSNGDATCTSDGTKTAECDYGCGAKDTIADEGSMIKHSFTNYVSNSDATCTSDGTKTAECDYGCGAKDTITDEGSKIAHSYGAPAWRWAADYSSATATFVCGNCGDTQIVNAVIDTTIVSDQTCTTDKIVTYTATVEFEGQNYTDKTDEIKLADALSHNFGAWEDYDIDNHIRTCSRCGATETEAHTFTEWTVVTKPTETTEGEETRICMICGRKENRPIEKLPALLLFVNGSETGANVVHVETTFARRGQVAFKLDASEDDVTYTMSLKGSKILAVDQDGNVRFVRLCAFCKTAVITATTPDGRTATCEVTVKLTWWQVIVYLLLGSLWY